MLNYENWKTEEDDFCQESNAVQLQYFKLTLEFPGNPITKGKKIHCMNSPGPMRDSGESIN